VGSLPANRVAESRCLRRKPVLARAFRVRNIGNVIASQPHSWLADNLAEEVSSKQLLKTPCTIDIQVPGIAMSQRRILRVQ
jgi:hypothetical protein